jgi:hypothetical protein
MRRLLLVPADKHYFTLIDYFYYLRFYFLYCYGLETVFYLILNSHIKISNFCKKAHITKKNNIVICSVCRT